MLLFWGFVIVLIVLAVRGFSGSRETNQLTTPNSGVIPEETPLDILKKRFAKGEISEDEYDLMKQRLI